MGEKEKNANDEEFKVPPKVRDVICIHIRQSERTLILNGEGIWDAVAHAATRRPSLLSSKPTV
jgi:hypothetical protein